MKKREKKKKRKKKEIGPAPIDPCKKDLQRTRK